MPINLGKWSGIAQTAIDFGFPALGMAFGIPGPVSTFAANMLKKALGLREEATPADVQATIEGMNPDTARAAFEGAQTEVTAKYQYLTRLAEVQAETDQKNIVEVNETIRKEIGKGVSWWHWRHLLGYVPVALGVELVVLVPMMAFGILTASEVTALIGAITPPLTILSGLLGYVAQDTTKLKETAITGERSEGIVATTLKAVTGKKK